MFLVCRYIYTGSVDVNMDVAQDLLRAADQYLLEGLKRLCEYAIAQVSARDLSISEEDLSRASWIFFIFSVGYLGGKCLSDVWFIGGFQCIVIKKCLHCLHIGEVRPIKCHAMVCPDSYPFASSFLGRTKDILNNYVIVY